MSTLKCDRDSLLGRLAQACRHVGMFQQIVGLTGQLGSVPKRHQTPGYFGQNEVPIAGNVGRDHGHGRLHRFDHGIALALVFAADPEQISVRQKLSDVLPSARETDVLRSRHRVAEPQ